MSRLIDARPDQIDAIYRESHALWGAGLGFEDYRGLWQDLVETEWGRRHAGFYVWVDDRGHLLSSMKCYRPRLLLSDRTTRATVLGAVFTPSSRRRQGHAADMVRAAIEQARRRAERFVLLFSDIGTDYYETLGFRALPAEEQWGGLPRAIGGGPEGWSLRPARLDDRGRIRRAHDEFCRRRPFAVIRDEEHWHFLQTRTERFFTRLKDKRLAPSFLVALHRGRFAGYLVAIEGNGDWNVREAGAPGGDPNQMATVIRVGALSARRRGLRGFYGWLPPEVARLLADWRIRHRRRRRAVPMVFGLDGSDDLASLDTAEAAYLPFQDQF